MDNYNRDVTHMVGMSTNEGNALETFPANHMNKPEDKVRWRWTNGELVIWDNRITMHYAVDDYLRQQRCMHRITVVRDRRTAESTAAA